MPEFLDISSVYMSQQTMYPGSMGKNSNVLIFSLIRQNHIFQKFYCPSYNFSMCLTTISRFKMYWIIKKIKKWIIPVFQFF